MDKDLLHMKAVREILSQVASGHYPEGSRLPAERTLCEHLGISRGTLRKALADLEKMGAVTIRPQSGIYIQRFSQAKLPRKVLPKNFKGVSLKDIIIARRAIEVSSIELACEQMDAADLEILRQFVTEMEKQVEDLPAYLASDMNFHEFLVKAGRNQVLITAFEAIAEYHKYSQVFSSTQETCEKDSLRHHQKIFKALERKDRNKAVRYLSDHFNHMLESVS